MNEPVKTCIALIEVIVFELKSDWRHDGIINLLVRLYFSFSFVNNYLFFNIPITLIPFFLLIPPPLPRTHNHTHRERLKECVCVEVVQRTRTTRFYQHEVLCYLFSLVLTKSHCIVRQ